MMTRPTIVLFALLFVVGRMLPVAAAVVTWDGTVNAVNGDNSWDATVNNPYRTNWNTNTQLGSADDVVIPAGSGQTVIDYSERVNTLNSAESLVVRRQVTTALMILSETQPSQINGLINEKWAGATSIKNLLTLTGDSLLQGQGITGGGFAGAGSKVVNAGSLQILGTNDDARFNPDIMVGEFVNQAEVDHTGVLGAYLTTISNEGTWITRGDPAFDEGDSYFAGYENPFINGNGATLDIRLASDAKAWMWMPLHNQEGGTVAIRSGTLVLAVAEQDPEPGGKDNWLSGGAIQIAPGATLEVLAGEPDWGMPPAKLEWTGGIIEGSGTGPGTIIIGGHMVVTAPPIEAAPPDGGVLRMDEIGDGKSLLNATATVLPHGRGDINDTFSFVRGHLFNEGTVRQTAHVSMKNHSGIDNQTDATYTVTGGAVIDTTTPESVQFVNTGAKFIKTGPGVATVDVGFDVQDVSQVQVHQGTLKVTRGGTHRESFFRITDGATLELAGEHAFENRVQFLPAQGSTHSGTVVLPGATKLYAWEDSTVEFSLTGDRFLVIDGAELLGPGKFVILPNTHTDFRAGEINVRGVVTDESVTGGLISQGNFIINGVGTKTIGGLLRNQGKMEQLGSLTTTANGLIYNEDRYELRRGTISGEGRFRSKGEFVKIVDQEPEATIDVPFDIEDGYVQAEEFATLIFRKGGKHSKGEYRGPGEIEFRGETTAVEGEMVLKASAKVLLTEGIFSIEKQGSLLIEEKEGDEEDGEYGLTINGAELEIAGKLIAHGDLLWQRGDASDPGDKGLIQNGARLSFDATPAPGNPPATAPILIGVQVDNDDGTVEVQPNTKVQMTDGVKGYHVKDPNHPLRFGIGFLGAGQWIVNHEAELTLSTDPLLHAEGPRVGEIRTIGLEAEVTLRGSGKLKNMQMDYSWATPLALEYDASKVTWLQGTLNLEDGATWNSTLMRVERHGYLSIDSTSEFYFRLMDIPGIGDTAMKVAFKLDPGGLLRVDGSLRVTGRWDTSPEIVALYGKWWGNGSITGKVINWGTVYPGGVDKVGTLTINGHYGHAETAEIVVDHDGASYDQLVVHGTVEFAGRVKPNGLVHAPFMGGDGAAGLLAPVGTTFDVITADSIIDNGAQLWNAEGVLMNLQIVDLDGERQAVRLTAIEPIKYGLLDGLWENGGNWSGGTPPEETETAFLPGDPTTDTTVAGPTNDTTVETLVVGDGDEATMGVATLQLGAGTLTATRGTTVREGGRIAGGGTIGNALFNGGEIQVAAGQNLLVDGAGNVNAGRIEIAEGGIEFTGGLANEMDTGQITARDATLRFGTGLTNDGQFEITSGTNHLYGNVTSMGTIAASENSSVTFHGNVTNHGTLDLATGSSAVFAGVLDGAGDTTGGGTVRMDGELRPGSSTAAVSFGGDLVFGASSSLQIELGVATSGSGHDQIQVAGLLDLSAANNTMTLDWLPAADAKFGGDYIVATYGSLAGEFDAVADGDGPYGIGQAYIAGVDYLTDDQITVSLHSLLDADADLDGDVDFGDYLILEAAFGGPGQWKDADFDFNGVVDFGDYLILEAAFGDSVPVESAAMNIPEPGTLAMLLAAIAGLACIRRRVTGRCSVSWRP